MNKETLERYAELKRQQKEIEEEIKSLSGPILEEIQNLGGDKLTSPVGTFSIEVRKTWKYSQSVKSAEEKIKELQATEKADGTATFDEMKFVKFYAPKQ